MKNFILPAVLLILVFFIFLSRFFITVRIDCKSQLGSCPGDIIEKLIPLDGKKMHYAQQEIKKVMEESLMVSDFSVRFNLPNVLKIDVITKKPVFVLKDISSGESVLLDREGIVLSKSYDSELPVVFTNETLPETGSKIDSENFFALELIFGLSKMYQIKKATIMGNYLLTDLPGKVRVLLPLKEADKKLLLGSLRLVYANIWDSDGKALYSEIDLRYKDPVLR